jgi:drug/metabolite transporter (DMT)-like permease
LLIATEPAFIVALTLLLKRQRIGWRVWAGGTLAIAGVALTSQGPVAPQSFSWISTLQALCGAASWSCYTVLASRLNQRYGTFGVTGAIVVVGTVALLAISIPMIHRVRRLGGIALRRRRPQRGQVRWRIGGMTSCGALQAARTT